MGNQQSYGKNSRDRREGTRSVGGGGRRRTGEREITRYKNEGVIGKNDHGKRRLSSELLS